MQRGFQKIIEAIAWLQITLSPLLIGTFIGIVVGITISVGLGIVIGMIGLVIGVSWATRISKREGASHYMSRIMATPELDEKNVRPIFMRDIICQVYAGEKSLHKIQLVLDKFLPEYEPLNLDYASKIDDQKYVFGSEYEMLAHFIDTPNVIQTFYWNQAENNPDRIMVGANITVDNKLIMSLTFNGTHEMESKYLDELKVVLQSTIGIVSYIDPAYYESGKDFCDSCASI